MSEAKRAYWLYEIQRGHGIYQGATGPGAEGIVRRVAEAEPGAGAPFIAYCFPGQPSALEMYEADYAAVTKAGFTDSGELLSAYNTLVKKHDWCADRIKKAETLLEDARHYDLPANLRTQIEQLLKE